MACPDHSIISIPAFFLLIHFRPFSGLIAALILSTAANGEREAQPTPQNQPPPVKQPAAAVSPELAKAIERLKLPGIHINLNEWCVDVESTVCLRQGLLELVASTKDGKVHESIIAVQAKPSHIHTALLLLGAKAGSPARRMLIDPEAARLIDIPPSGSPVDVSLVIPDGNGKPVEHPISHFILPANDSEDPDPDNDEESQAGRKFPTSTFLFAGSILIDAEEGPRKYLSDLEGNVISLSTFGDELLCLPGIHGHANERLSWQVDSDQLPALDSKVTLRLRPQVQTPPPAEKPPTE